MLIAYTQEERTKLAGVPSQVSINDTNGYEISTDDSTKTVGFLSAVDGVQLQIDNNGLGGNYSNLPTNVTGFVAHPDGDALLDQEDGNYSISVQFNIRPDVRDKSFLIEFIAQNGGAPIPVFARDIRLAKQLKDESVSISFSLPAITPLVNLPISVFLTMDETDAIIWGQSLSVTKNNAPIV